MKFVFHYWFQLNCTPSSGQLLKKIYIQRNNHSKIITR